MPANRRPVAKSRSTRVDDAARCALCSYGSDGSVADRLRHVREEHPEYFRGLLLRLVAPFVFIAFVGLLAVAKADTWAYFIALLLTLGLVVSGMRSTSRDPTRTTERPDFRHLLRNGGVRFLLFGIAGIALLVLSFTR